MTIFIISEDESARNLIELRLKKELPLTGVVMCKGDVEAVKAGTNHQRKYGGGTRKIFKSNIQACLIYPENNQVPDKPKGTLGFQIPFRIGVFGTTIKFIVENLK